MLLLHLIVCDFCPNLTFVYFKKFTKPALKAWVIFDGGGVVPDTTAVYIRG